MWNLNDHTTEILRVYAKHGWQMKRLLLKPEARPLMDLSIIPGDVRVDDASFNALWFARASHGGREAWELRLLAEPPFALFETFEPDETEEQREEMRSEMESRMRARDERGNDERGMMNDE